MKCQLCKVILTNKNMGLVVKANTRSKRYMKGNKIFECYKCYMRIKKDPNFARKLKKTHRKWMRIKGDEIIIDFSLI